MTNTGWASHVSPSRFALKWKVRAGGRRRSHENARSCHFDNGLEIEGRPGLSAPMLGAFGRLRPQQCGIGPGRATFRVASLPRVHTRCSGPTNEHAGSPHAYGHPIIFGEHPGPTGPTSPPHVKSPSVDRHRRGGYRVGCRGGHSGHEATLGLTRRAINERNFLFMTRLRAVIAFLQKTSRSWPALGSLALAAGLTTLLLLGGGRPARAGLLFQSSPPAQPEPPTATPVPPPPPPAEPTGAPPPPPEAPPAEPTSAPPPAQVTVSPVPPTVTPTNTPTRRPRRTRTPAGENPSDESPQFIVDAAKLIDTLALYGARAWQCCCGYSALIWIPALLILLYIGGRRQISTRKRKTRRTPRKSRWKYWEDEWEESSPSWDTYDEE